jgi:hypothetical protein
MTNTQTYAFLALIIMAFALLWIGYLFGRRDGKEKGIAIGQAQERDAKSSYVEALRNRLELTEHEYTKLNKIYRLTASKGPLGADERQTLIDIAEKLQLSADTFQALGSKGQADKALMLRHKALRLADLIQPAQLERAA